MSILPVVLTLALAGPAGGVDTFRTALEAFERGDYPLALETWLPLAEQGSPEAQYNIGLIYQGGYGVAADPGEAASWYEKAARGGFVRAQFDLARLCEAREATPGNLVRAYAWYKLAGQQKYPNARKSRRRVADRLTDYEIAQGDLFVREWNRAREEARRAAKGRPDR